MGPRFSTLHDTAATRHRQSPAVVTSSAAGEVQPSTVQLECKPPGLDRHGWTSASRRRRRRRLARRVCPLDVQPQQNIFGNVV